MKSEHEHYGPYMYLKVMTWPEPGIDSNAISGPLTELSRLASLIENCLAPLKPEVTLQIADDFVPSMAYSLVLDLRFDGFDPASADANLVDEAR